MGSNPIAHTNLIGDVIGFFESSALSGTKARQNFPVALLNRQSCALCPLNTADIISPKMAPSGPKNAKVLILGEAPGCISGDSLIEVAYRDKSKYPDGIPIKDLVGKSGFKVYSFDTKNQKLVLGEVERVWKTGRKKVYKVSYEWVFPFGNDRIVLTDFVIVTANHPFLLKHRIKHDPFLGRGDFGQYLSIEQGLSIGHSLQPFHRNFTAKGYSMVGVAAKAMFREGRFLLSKKIGRDVSKNEECHHKNHIKLDDTFDNLILTTKAEHAQIHYAERGNPMDFEWVRHKHAAAMQDDNYKMGQSERRRKFLSNEDNYKKLIEAIESSNEARSETVRKKYNDPKFFARYLRGRMKYFGWSQAEVRRRFTARFPEAFLPRVRLDNHIITKIEYAGVSDVYDMEVKKYHNFSLHGIFVHNSEEDKDGEPFVGRTGRFLRSYIPREWRGKVRMSNVIHCWPGIGNPDPTSVQVECCRPRNWKDIEETAPKAILGLGGFALQWAAGEGRITLWRGRRLPIKVGNHSCWFFPMEHPSYIMRKLEEPGFHHEDQVFGFDIRNAFAEIPYLPEAIVHTKEQAQSNLILIKGDEPGALAKLEKFLLKAAQAPQSGVDYETTVPARPYYPEAKILSAGVSAGKMAMGFAWDHPQAGWSAKDKKRLREIWIQFLRTAKRKCVHGLSFEQEWTGVVFGIDLLQETRETWEDTLSQAFTIDSRSGGEKGDDGQARKVKNGPLSLGWLTTQHFGLNIKKFSGVKTTNLINEPIEPVLRYNAVDARYHEQLFLAQEIILKQKGLQEQYNNLLQRVPTTVLTKIKGVPINQAITKKLNDEYSEELLDIEAEIHASEDVQWFEKKYKEPFTVSKNQQIMKLYASMGTPLDNADEKALKEVDNLLSEQIISWRKVFKRRNYVLAYMLGKGLWPDGLIHPDYSTAYVGTTRSSAFDPNIQNAIKRDEVGKRVRRQIEAPPGHVIVSVDQGQIQWRNIGMESRDKYLCQGLWDYPDYDVHMEWAERLAHAYPRIIGGKENIKDKDIMKKFRGDVKNQWVFPWCFNARRESREGYLGVPEGTFIQEDRMMEKLFSGVAQWKETIYEFYKDNGYTTGLTGFRRPAPLSPNEICNSPIQSDEAIVLFDGFNRLSKRNDPHYQANMEIHDDLEFILPLDGLYDYVKVIVSDMLQCSFDWICTPLSVEVAIGKHWYHMEEVHKIRSDRWFGQPFRQFRFGDK